MTGFYRKTKDYDLKKLSELESVILKTIIFSQTAITIFFLSHMPCHLYHEFMVILVSVDTL
jgi:hypothetical protein